MEALITLLRAMLACAELNQDDLEPATVTLIENARRLLADTCERTDCECEDGHCARNDTGDAGGFDSTANYMKSALGGGR